MKIGGVPPIKMAPLSYLMAQNGPKWPKMAQNSPKGPHQYCMFMVNATVHDLLEFRPFWVRHKSEISSKLGQKSTFDAKMPVSKPADGIFGVYKGQKPSKFGGPITGHQAN